DELEAGRDRFPDLERPFLSLVDRLPGLVDQACDEGVIGGAEALAPAGEVRVEGVGGNAGEGGDLVDRGGRVAAFGGNLGEGLDQSLALGSRVRAPMPV